MLDSQASMVSPRSWDEFRDSKMLWWVNRMLHTFGWAIAVELDDRGKVVQVYPARVKSRGFSESAETEGFTGLTRYLVDNSRQLYAECVSAEVEASPRTPESDS